MDFLEETVQNNKDIASTEIIGTTEERRILKVIKLRKGNPSRSIWMGKKQNLLYQYMNEY